MTPGSIEDFRKVIALSELPEEHLQWIFNRCEYVTYEDGKMVGKTGDPIDSMFFIAVGKLAFYMDVNGRLVHYFTFGNDERTGGLSGLLPYSRMKGAPGSSFAVGDLVMYKLHKSYFQELEHLNPDFIQRLIGYMTERARGFATQKLQYEKVNALGQLAAGIAHELNNPAAAINRISADLIKRLMQNYDLTESLLEKGVRPELIKTVRNLADSKKSMEQETKLSPLQRIEKEDELFDWLEKIGINNNREVAETFAESGFSVEELEGVCKMAGNEAFRSILEWLENILSSQRIIKDMDIASGRISNLVGAIKSHVHLDRTQEMQPTNLHEDLDNTITLLGYKIREKNIVVTRNYCHDMREVPAYIGELNQVWTNLIDNAIFAMDKNGELIVETKCDNKEVQVLIIDNGMGIPPDIVSRIFDPFFTTKKVGEGTGIGLDLVMRIVTRHNGEIKVNSTKGRTEFVVCLPFGTTQMEPSTQSYTNT